MVLHHSLTISPGIPATLSGQNNKIMLTLYPSCEDTLQCCRFALVLIRKVAQEKRKAWTCFYRRQKRSEEGERE